VPRLPRKELPDGIYHVTSRGVDRMAIFRDDIDRRAFLALYRDVRGRLTWIVHAYCLMTSQFHLVVDTSLPLLRYGVHVIQDEEYLQSAVDYVLANPVRAGLVERPEDWPWARGPLR
jgi:REP element-mobilizing transposase RayT